MGDNKLTQASLNFLRGMSSFLPEGTRYIAAFRNGNDQQTEVHVMPDLTSKGTLDIPSHEMTAIFVFADHAVALLDTIRLLQEELEEVRSGREGVPG